MLEELTFCNHKGEKLQTGIGGIFANSNDLRDYDWDYTTQSGKITGFSKGIVKKTIPLPFIGKTEADGVKIKNQLLDLAEKDIIEKSPGKIIIGDYYMTGYVIGSKKSDYLLSRRYLNNELTWVTEKPYWIKESVYTYSRITSSDTDYEYLDFPYDFPYDYCPGNTAMYLENKEITPADFKAVIMGPCTNPVFAIAGNNYKIVTDISSYEYVVLNTEKRTVYKVSRTGLVTNIWNSLEKEYDNFAQIPSGMQAVQYDQSYNLQITLYQKRSEPKWT